MSVDNSSNDASIDGAVDVADEQVADGAVVEADGQDAEPDKVEQAAQGLITVGLFIAFVTFIIFCLPMYFFN